MEKLKKKLHTKNGQTGTRKYEQKYRRKQNGTHCIF